MANGSSSMTLFDHVQAVGGNHILLNDPAQLSILGIRIAAQCTFEEVQRSRRISSTPRTQSNNDHIHRSTSSRSRTSSQPRKEDDTPSTMSSITASTSTKTNTAAFPPSSFKDPLASKDPIKQRRPRSVEIGAKAKGAMMDLGRKGLYGLRNLSKSDVSQVRDQNQLVIAPSMNDTDDLIAISTSNGNLAVDQRRASSHSIGDSTTSKAQSLSSNSQTFPSMENEEQETIRTNNVIRSILRVRRTYRLRPCSMTYGRESPSSGQAVPISVINRVEARSASIGGEDSGWERLEGTLTEYMVDAEQANSSFASNEGRAGHFYSIDSRSTSEGQDNSEYDDTQDSFINDSTMGHTGELSNLLLKVSSPTDTFARIAGAERIACGWRDEVVLKIRLQVKSSILGSSFTPISPSSSNRTIPAGPRRPRSSSLSSESNDEKQILFLSCNSSKKLCDAIEASRIRQSGLKGPLSSQSSAKLEGIEWVPVQNSTTLKPTDFEWSWKDSSNGQQGKMQSSSNSAVKCACAFVTLDKMQSTVQPLAFFQFIIQRPPSSFDQNSIKKPTFVWMDLPQKQANGKAQQKKPLFNGQAIGLGLEGVDSKVTEQSHRPAPSRSRTTSSSIDEDQMKTKARILRPSLTATKTTAYAPQKLKTSELLFASPSAPLNTAKALINFSSSDINHVELELDDVESDSPVFRATIQNIERRTTNLKRVAKGILKAANDVSQAIEELQVTEVRLDHTFEDMAPLIPSTFGRLYSDWLFRSRETEREKREQTIAMLETHIIAPMRAVVDMCRELVAQLKTFDTESKAYYSATQKWLSGKSSNQTIVQPSLNEYSPEAIGFDKAMIKQEKLDEKQKWRQLRFDLSRFEMYRSICTLHEGEAEILLASHMLALCRWHCKDFSAENVFRSFDSTVQAEMINVKAKTDAALEKCVDLDRKIAEHQRLMLSREGDGQMGIEQSPIPDIQSDNQLGIASRQTGHKLKSLLTSIGVGHLTSPTTHSQPHSIRQPFSCPIPPATNFDTIENDSPLKQPRQQTVLESKSPIGSIATTSPSIPASGNKWQARLRSFSFSKSPTMYDSERRLFADASHTNQNSQSLDKTSIPDVNIVTAETMMADTSPRRSVSMSGSRQSPNKRPVTLDLSSITSTKAPLSPKTTKSYDNGRSSVTFSIQSPREAEAIGSTQQAKTSTSDDRTAFLTIPMSQPQRKKEGILWAMTKPIQGMGRSDAPRSVSRPQNWRECWVVLSGSGHLGEYAHWKDAKAMTLEPSQPLIDLRFAAVREARGVERRFTFEVITRENRRFFQASNDEDMRGWIGAIGFAIESLINGTSSIRQIDKVARHSAAQAIDSFGMTADSASAQEFGDGMRHVFDNALSPSVHSIGAHKSFSQSLTDLSSAASGRLFNRIGNNNNNNNHGTSMGRDEISKVKRDSRNLHGLGSRGHLLALSEGDHAGSSSHEENEENGVKDGIPFTPLKNEHHSRGISNNTPVSGYMAGLNGHSSTLHVGSVDDGRSPSSSSLNINTEFDKRIEAMIHRSYGIESSSSANSGSGFHSRAHSSNRDSNGLTISSSVISRNPSSIGPGSADEEGRLMNKQSEDGSNKFSRAREILAIASLPQNRHCADCRKREPRWASWSLNGMPCCIFICIECSGIHRGLGVNVSKVRSIDLDDWNEQQLRAARIWGNERVNAIYEANKPNDCTVSSMGDVRTKAFWMTKYVEQAWFSLHANSHNDSNQTIIDSHEKDEEEEGEELKHCDLTSSQSYKDEKEKSSPWQGYLNEKISIDQQRYPTKSNTSKMMIMSNSSSEQILQQSTAHNRIRTSLPPSAVMINPSISSNSAASLPRISA